MGRLGAFWNDPELGGTVTVERAILAQGAVPEDSPDFPFRVEERVGDWLDSRPDRIAVVRLDWRDDQCLPENAPQREQWRQRLAWAVNLDRYRGRGDRLIMSMGNEPNHEGENQGGLHWGDVADLFNGVDLGASFCGIVRAWLPDVGLGTTPIAPYNPHDLGAPPAPGGLEDSPWGRLAYHVLARIRENQDGFGLGPTALLEHVYGQPPYVGLGLGPSMEPWDDPTTPEGWRFGMNVCDTWDAVHEFAGYWTHPVVVTEVNTAARGVAPIYNYERGWLQHAYLRAEGAFGELLGFCWFVGRDWGGWNLYELLNGMEPRLVAARADYGRMLEGGL